MEKCKKSLIRTINLKFQLQHGMENLNYLTDHILYQIFKIILNISLKKHETVTDNLSVRIYVNKIKIESRITFKIKAGYYLKLLTPETMKLLGSTKSKTTKDENGENVCNLEVIEVILAHCNIANNDYQQDSRSYIHLFLINHLVYYYIFPQTILYFKNFLTQSFHIFKYDLLIKTLKY